MQILSSLVFILLLSLSSFLIPVTFIIPSFLFKSRKIADFGAKLWAKMIIFFLDKVCNINYKIIDPHNIIKTPCIFACKHQSMWETVIMHLIISRPVYAYKTELTKIPFYGWFLSLMSGIKVDRSGRASSLKHILQQSKQYLQTGQSIVIFPQGTRVPVNGDIAKYPYQSGIVAMYQFCNVPVVPIALNSGLFLPKNIFNKKSGTIAIKFLPPINPGLDKKLFLDTLTNQIEQASLNL